MSFEIPQAEEVDDLLLSCRYGDLEDVREFVAKFGINELVKARDERENCALHMCCANGHDDLLEYILSLEIPPTFVRARNEAGSTPLHWACLNAHLPCVQRLVGFTPQSLKNTQNEDATSSKEKGRKRIETKMKTVTISEKTGEEDDDEAENDEREGEEEGEEDEEAIGATLILLQNKAGHTPLGEAELSGWDEGARWLVGAMNLDLDASSVPTPVSPGDDVDIDAGEGEGGGEEVLDGEGKEAKGSKEENV